MKNLNLIATLSFSLIISNAFSQSAGTLDATFGTGGIVTTSFLGDNDGEAVAIQDDGKIVLVGNSDDPTNNLNLRVIRYLSDGSIDNSFGISGTVVLSGPLSAGRDVVIQPDGKIVAIGTINGPTNLDMLAVRLNADGTFDNGFGTGGMVSFDATGSELGHGVALQSDGKIIITGIVSDGTGTDAVAVRLNADGTTDTAFGNSGTQGMARVDVNAGTDYSEACLIQDDGKIVLVGTHFSSPLGDILVARLNDDGTIDLAFGTNGVVLTDIALGRDNGTSCALQSDGKIVVIGDTEINIGPLTHEEFITLRYNTDGTLDNSFNVSGYVTGDLDNGPDVGTSIAVQSDGSIVVAGDGMVDVKGDSISHIAMFRYLPDGSADNTFGTGGKVITSIGSDEDLCNGMALDPNNGQYIILVGESADSTSDSDFALVRYENTVSLSSLDFDENPPIVYPNPINNQSVIEYSLLQSETVSIKLYNLRGELIQTILDETPQEQGDHQIMLEIDSKLPHGNYLLKVETASSLRSIEVSK